MFRIKTHTSSERFQFLFYEKEKKHWRRRRRTERRYYCTRARVCVFAAGRSSLVYTLYRGSVHGSFTAASVRGAVVSDLSRRINNINDLLFTNTRFGYYPRAARRSFFRFFFFSFCFYEHTTDGRTDILLYFQR